MRLMPKVEKSKSRLAKTRLQLEDCWTSCLADPLVGRPLASCKSPAHLQQVNKHFLQRLSAMMRS